jgi:hypothetical protein
MGVLFLVEKAFLILIKLVLAFKNLTKHYSRGKIALYMLIIKYLMSSMKKSNG